MKYVIFKHKDLFMPVVFPDHVTHSQVKVEDAEPISAGFITIKPNRLSPCTVYGRSESLGLVSRVEDGIILNQWFCNMGIGAFMDWGMGGEKSIEP